MKSIFVTEINVPQAKLAEFYTNPENNIKWMHDLERVEHVSGQPGTIGYQYRLVPKKGNMIFVAKLEYIDLPNGAQVLLESSNVNVLVTGTFFAISPEKTRFISEEIFTFKGIFNQIFGFLAQHAIKKAHFKHMNDFREVVKDLK